MSSFLGFMSHGIKMYLIINYDLDTHDTQEEKDILTKLDAVTSL